MFYQLNDDEEEEEEEDEKDQDDSEIKEENHIQENGKANGIKGYSMRARDTGPEF